MQYDLLNYLRCPITKTGLRFELISEFKKCYSEKEIIEIDEGLLFSTEGFVFPIIDGIPRMLIESIYDYSDFLSKHLPNYDEIKNKIENKYSGLLNYCVSKNKKTKKSFEFEWSFFNAKKKDRIWHRDISKISIAFLNETGESPEFFRNNHTIDVGCGLGLMTTVMAGFSDIAIGIELSKAVEKAYLMNTHSQAWYVQGDLDFLPFENSSFDFLYSSGVIHHTKNTELALSLIEPVLKKEGKISLWLYHPQKSTGHKLILLIRKLTSRLPLKLAFVFLVIFIFPFTFLIKRIKKKNPPNYREEIIDLLDAFTPEFRFEIPHDLAIVWLQRRGYGNIQVTTTNTFGFSIVGEK